ncbi:ribosome small subunit-dependent GTPase A [Tuberibacillus sp. Marseille-P3662]|uniref:ribosome small subunit-dependent GTPase A n=1 Tax=Tuberibacillus sp. Marseille-P3662 TaxID=1965358 RepID=UPI000A1C9E5E|nr:ribosome small subunit-dependent GTPase A [Tuberibacillus sp. Marseille-P3662]
MPEGRILKALSGYYYVKNDEGTLIQCRGRGKFRKQKITPLVGDRVEYTSQQADQGYIMAIHERENQLIRPPIANVDAAILTFSTQHPTFDRKLLDRFLVQIEAHDIEPVICITKFDLLPDTEKDRFLEVVGLYRDIGYTVLITSAYQGDGLNLLKDTLGQRLAVFAGQSGVGKSSVLNALDASLELETTEISRHLGRGKHTTRHVELLEIGGALIADTPGFSSLDFHGIASEDLSIYFADMRPLIPECKFRGCLHDSEPGCAVKSAVESGDVDQTRYDHYKMFLQEIKNEKRRY